MQQDFTFEPSGYPKSSSRSGSGGMAASSTLARGGLLAPNGPSLRNGSVSHSEDDSSGSSIPPSLDVSVVLPSGSIYQLTVESGMQMMDLLVKVAASNKLSPASHTLLIYGEDNRPVQYLASSTVYSVGHTTLHLVSKKQETKRPAPTKDKPFEVTHRLTVNLPRNQKWVTRVSQKSTLADIFKMICTEKNLDPYKYELRHPTKPDEALNMASPLESFRINEINVVPVNVGREGEKYSSLDYEVEESSTASMPLRRSKSKGELEQPAGYMPGMEAEGKKKRGIFKLFSRGKTSSFKLDEDDRSTPAHSQHDMSYNDMSGGAKHNVVVRSRSPPAPAPIQGQANGPQTANGPHAAPQAANGPQAAGPARTSTTSVHSHSSNTSDPTNTAPHRPPRKKRLAPPPPPGSSGAPQPPGPPQPPQPSMQTPLSVSIHNKENAHSRTSSHSSGFDESNTSPLESPGNSSRESTKTSKTKMSIDATSIESDSHDTVTRSTGVKTEAAIKEELPANGTLTRPDRKKRRAPPPPPTGASPPASPPAAAPTPPNLGATIIQTGNSPEAMKSAVLEELKQESQARGSEQTQEAASRPKPQFIAPPPPDSPPPPLSPRPLASPPLVVDSCIQVHVSSRSGRIESQTSEVSIEDFSNEQPAQSPVEPAAVQPSLEATAERKRTSVVLALTSESTADTPQPPSQPVSQKAKKKKKKMDGHESDSDASSDTSSVMAYDVNLSSDDKLDDEAVPCGDDSVILTSKRSIEETDPVSPVLVRSVSAEKQEMKSMVMNAPQLPLQPAPPALPDSSDITEISFDNINVIYVNPDDEKAQQTKTDESSTDPHHPTLEKQDSFYADDNSPKDEEPMLINDYRVTNVQSDDIMDFKFGGGNQPHTQTVPARRKEENVPIVTSLRAAYRRSAPVRADDVFKPAVQSPPGQKRESELFTIIKRDSSQWEEKPYVEVRQPEEESLSPVETKSQEVRTVSSPPPPPALASPPPPVASPTPQVASPTPQVASPTPQVASPPPPVASPPPPFASPPPAMSSPQPPLPSPPVSFSPPPPEPYFTNSNTSNNNRYDTTPETADIAADKVWEIIEEKKTSTIESKQEFPSPPDPYYKGSATLPRSNSEISQQNEVRRSSLEGKRAVSVPKPWNAPRGSAEVSLSGENNSNQDSKARQETRRLSALVGPQGFVRHRQEYSFAHPAEAENESVLEEKSISLLSSPPRPSSGRVAGDTGNKDQLQKQYDDLQKQFHQWEQQLQENQAIINKKVTTKSDTLPTASSIPASPPPPPPIGYIPPSMQKSQPVKVAKQPDARYERPKSTSSMSSGGLAGRFSADDLLSAKANLRRSQSEFDPTPSSPPISKAENSINNNTMYSVEPREGSPSSSSSYKRRTMGTANPATQPAAKSNVAVVSRSNKRFEIQMDPREELMIAIRNAGGRNALRKVPVNQTKWFFSGAAN